MLNKTKISKASTLVKKIAANSKGRKMILKNMRKKFDELGHGVFRTVFNVGGVAVKIRNPEPGECWGSFSQRECDNSNRDEYNAYRSLASDYPSLAMCVLKPTYLKLANGHDAILMPLVSVLDDDTEDLYDAEFPGFTRNMKRQYEFITNHFRDAHDHNIGWSVEEDRVWIIDMNVSHNNYDEDSERQAKRLLKRKAA
jgi:hypothetical protein